MSEHDLLGFYSQIRNRIAGMDERTVQDVCVDLRLFEQAGTMADKLDVLESLDRLIGRRDTPDQGA